MEEASPLSQVRESFDLRDSVSLHTADQAASSHLFDMSDDSPGPISRRASHSQAAAPPPALAPPSPVVTIERPEPGEIMLDSPFDYSPLTPTPDTRADPKGRETPPLTASVESAEMVPTVSSSVGSAFGLRRGSKGTEWKARSSLEEEEAVAGGAMSPAEAKAPAHGEGRAKDSRYST